MASSNLVSRSIFSFSVLFSVLFICVSSTASAQEDPSCDFVLGNWAGVFDEPNSFLLNPYRFESSYDEDGTVIIDFFFLDSAQTDRHEGIWSCENGIVTTGLLSRSLQPVLYQYRILDISLDEWRYQLIAPFADAPIFHADRAPSRLIRPEILGK